MFRFPFALLVLAVPVLAGCVPPELAPGSDRPAPVTMRPMDRADPALRGGTVLEGPPGLSDALVSPTNRDLF